MGTRVFSPQLLDKDRQLHHRLEPHGPTDVLWTSATSLPRMLSTCLVAAEGLTSGESSYSVSKDGGSRHVENLETAVHANGTER